MKDVYMPVYTYHYQGFPFKDAIVYDNSNRFTNNEYESDSNVDINKMEMADFH
ncbi:hypothetical protein GVAV_003330 [Gurleya vavrai]